MKERISDTRARSLIGGSPTASRQGFASSSTPSRPSSSARSVNPDPSLIFAEVVSMSRVPNPAPP
jgi:hypothetical protein